MLSGDVVLRVKKLGKSYHIYDCPQDRLKQMFFGRFKKFYREFWALKDISFELRRGQSFGIIGRNGAGKSTLLQLICGTLTPTEGVVEVKGRIAALLELGAGFNAEFTGRENIYLNGAILGFTLQEIQKHFDEIVSFADIGDFIEQPVKTYSTGMFVRLAFAVQACLEPDILVVDEALAVGDVFFQQKCMERIKKLQARGTTLIFVSHDMGMIRDLCQTGIYLCEGRSEVCGLIEQAIRSYLLEAQITKKEFVSTPRAFAVKFQKHGEQWMKDFSAKACWINSVPDQNQPARLFGVSLVNGEGHSSLKCKIADVLKFQVAYQLHTELPVDLMITLRNRYNHVVYASGSYHRLLPPKLNHGDYAIFELAIDCMLEAGQYTFHVSLYHQEGFHNCGRVMDETPWLGPLIIDWDYAHDCPPFTGMFGLPSRVRFLPLETFCEV